MRKYIIITADENDADYIERKSLITDEQIEKVKIMVEAIKAFKPYKGKEWRVGDFWDCRHNYPTREIVKKDRGELSAEEYYIGKGKEIEDAFYVFDQFVPSNEYGIHTIKSVEILTILEEERLL